MSGEPNPGAERLIDHTLASAGAGAPSRRCATWAWPEATW